MRASFFKKCAWVVLAIWTALWAYAVWHTRQEWLGLTALYIGLGGLGASRFFGILNAPEERGYFIEELPEKTKPGVPIQPPGPTRKGGT